MKYKILKGTDLFNILTAVRRKMEAAKDAASAIAKEVGAEGVSDYSYGIAGGIAAFYFKEGANKAKPGWKKMEKGYSHWFLPLRGDKRNKELWQRIDKLPIVKTEEISGPLNYKFQVFSHGEGLAASHTPAVDWRDDYILIAVHENSTYEPVEGMIEITGSEYKALQHEAAEAN